MILIQDLGTKFPTKTSKTKSRYGLYECINCHKPFETITRKRMTGMCKSCATTANATTHGYGYTKLNKIWNAMKSRCYTSTNTAYVNYGGRGITICDEWKTSFIKFKEWSEINGYMKGLQIDRKNNNKEYSPTNCRFVPKTVQARNTRRIMSTNTSGYRGVGLKKSSGRYYAAITLNNKTKHIGYFDTALDAALAYNEYIETNNLEHTQNII